MNEITLTVEGSDGKTRATRFTIWRRSDLEKKERYALMSDGAELISGDDWDDEGFARDEKQAAMMVGIEHGESFLVKFEYV